MLFITSLSGVRPRSGLIPKTQGFSLLEVLVATFILSFGLLGMAELYFYSFRRVEESFRQTLEISKLVSTKEEYASLFSSPQSSSEKYQ